ncbi:MAG: hypothetical protein IJH60_00260 [Eubacterium sp.]|nr:hypothetical protein [Eubacterium sp.]
MCPLLYLDSFYDMLKKTGNINLVMEEIVKTRVNAYVPMGNEEDVTRQLEAYDWVKDHLMIRTCDLERNRERLKDAVYTMQGDFAGVAYVVLHEEENGVCSCMVRKEYLEGWGVTEETVIADALECNNKKEVIFRGLNEYLMQLDEDAMETDIFPGGPPLYVLTNSFNTYGTSVMFNTEAMDRIAFRFGDGYFVIPSSVHELLVVPREEGFEPDMFNTMISEVNENEVSAEEILSYHVQYYDLEDHMLKRA